MKNPGYRDPGYLARPDLDRELTRVFEHCQDCRRCLPLCPSFPSLFDAIDGHEQEAARLTPSETRNVIDQCYQCKLCYNHCPYHAPHEWMIDFPRLMGRAKIVQAQEEGIPLAERLGMQQDLMGRGCCKTSALANLAFQSRPLRALMERGTGIDRRWPMPTYQSRPSSRELRSRPPAEAGQDRVVLYTTCFVEYSGGETARATWQVLEHNGIAVEAGYEACCGAPFLHGGDLAGARRSAERVVASLAPHARAGLPIIVPGPTCSGQIRHEYPRLLDSEEARLVADHTLDLGEYLYKLAAAKKLRREFPNPLGRVAYHVPCHLKAQSVGFRSRQVLELAGAEVELFEHCSGVDGTWGMKARWYEQSLQVAKKLIEGLERSGADHFATDCPLAALRIQERTGRPAVHPVVLLRDAYGLGPAA